MSETRTDLDRAQACTLAVLVLAASKQLEITPTKLALLLFLADVRSVDRDGITGSGIAWHWERHGPSGGDLNRVLDELGDRCAVEIESAGGESGPEGTGPEGSAPAAHPIRARGSVHGLSDDFLSHIEAVLDKMGAWSASQLKKHCCETPPMVHAMAQKRPGQLLDFSGMGQLTLADIEASKGMGPECDSAEPVVYASTEEFLASLRQLREAQRGGLVR